MATKRAGEKDFSPRKDGEKTTLDELGIPIPHADATPTVIYTWHLFTEEGKQVAEIVAERKLKETTVYGQLARAIDLGFLDGTTVIPQEMVTRVCTTASELGTGLRPKPIFSALNRKVSYGVISCALETGKKQGLINNDAGKTPAPETKPVRPTRPESQPDVVKVAREKKPAAGKALPPRVPAIVENAPVVITEEQKRVIEASPSSRMLVLAGPGTGKTEVVARRLNHILSQGIQANHILVLSFSRSAVKALMNRISQFGETSENVIDRLRFLSVRTFDAWTFRVLRMLGSNPDELLKSDYEENIARLTTIIKEKGLVGIARETDLPLDQLKHLVIDEAQDLSGPRAQMVKVLLSELQGSQEQFLETGFTILGDPRQAIYDWSRADGELSSRDLFDWMRGESPGSLEEVSLTINHRAGAEVQELLKQVSEIIETADREDRDPRPDLSRLLEEEVRTKDLDEFIKNLLEERIESTAILCRDNSMAIDVSIQIKKELPPEHQRRIHLSMGPAPPVIPAWVAVFFCRLESTHLARSQFLTIFQQLVDGVKCDLPFGKDVDRTWTLLLNFAHQPAGATSLDMAVLRERIHWLDSLSDDIKTRKPSLLISTIHQSKGLEYSSVLLADTAWMEDDRDGVEVGEEARVAFVAVSRARSNIGLFILPEQPGQFCKHKKTKRWHKWLPTRNRKGTWNCLEIGINGDVVDKSFVDMEFHENGNIARIQDMLADENALRGREITLKFRYVPDGDKGRCVYGIFLDPGEDEIPLGYMSDNFSLAIRDIKHVNQKWPANIYGLRIGDVTTITGDDQDDPGIEGSWRKSRLWLGISIHGIGQFTTFWKK